MTIPYGEVGEQWWDAHFLSLDYGFGKSSASAHLHVRTQDGRIKTVGEFVAPHLPAYEFAGEVVRNSPVARSFSSPTLASILSPRLRKKRATHSGTSLSASSPPWWYVLSCIGVAIVLTGVVPWQTLLDDAAPVANSLKGLTASTHSATLRWVELGVLFGAMMGMISSLLVFQLGQSRVWFSMSSRRPAAPTLRARASSLSYPLDRDLDRWVCG